MVQGLLWEARQATVSQPENIMVLPCHAECVHVLPDRYIPMNISASTYVSAQRTNCMSHSD
jgi:hypothetical protein